MTTIDRNISCFCNHRGKYTYRYCNHNAKYIHCRHKHSYRVDRYIHLYFNSYHVRYHQLSQLPFKLTWIFIWTHICLHVLQDISFSWLLNHCGIHPVHYDVIRWKHFPRYWPFVRGIHRWAWINSWGNNHEAGDLTHHRAHYDVIVMQNISTATPVKVSADCIWYCSNRIKLIITNLLVSIVNLMVTSKTLWI